LDTESDDASIAHALEQNQYISRIRVRLSQRDANWDHLYRVLAMRQNLVHFVLFRRYALSLRAPAERPILQAIQQNNSLRVVEFSNCITHAEEFCSFLDTAVHVRELKFSLRSSRHLGARGARRVAGALGRNTNIATLTLCGGSFLDTVLEGLASNSCVRRLLISCVLRDATRDTLQGLIESTQSIQYLELHGIPFTGQSFGLIAQALIHASIVLSMQAL